MSTDLVLHVDHGDPDDEDLVMCCMGGAVYGRRGCTCWVVAETVVEPDAREGLPCHDCAGLPGSREDESGAWLRISRQKVPFYCHAGMTKAITFRHEVTGETKAAEPDAYQPPRVDGVPMRADGTPARRCVCWERLQRGGPAT